MRPGRPGRHPADLRRCDLTAVHICSTGCGARGSWAVARRRARPARAVGRGRAGSSRVVRGAARGHDARETTVRAPRTTRTVERRAAVDGRPELELVRSTRRRRSASAQARDGRIVVQLPAGLPAVEEERLIAGLVAKVTDRARASQLDDAALLARAEALADRYVDGVRPVSVTWSSRMQKRYGSCSYAAGTIRVSNRLAGAPDYVLDSVLVHELAHLVEHDHGPAFRRLVARYPHEDRARAFLEGLEFADLRGVLPVPD
ncbi:MAG: M48 family metallopeptidase [Actinobacteria bacterium]|nr:M48 family metallopeptidase [Actinomycetota bacterium]